MRQEKDCAILTPSPRLFSFSALVGGCSSAWLEPQIVDLDVAGSNPVSHPILLFFPSQNLPAPLSKPPLCMPLVVLPKNGCGQGASFPKQWRVGLKTQEKGECVETTHATTGGLAL